MKSIKQIREASGGKEAYQKFFNSILKRFGVGSPAELEGDAKKKFYDAIDAGWDGDNEKPEPGDKKKNENTDDFKSDEDVPDDKGNYTMGDMAESPAIALKVAAAIDKKNEKKKSVKEIRVKPVDEKMGMCEQCGTMHEEGDCPQSDMDMSDLDPDTKGMEERAKGTASKKDLAKQAKMTAAMNRRKSYREGTEIKEKTKLKGARGKLGPKDAIDINFMGDKKDIKFASTKWKINIKPHSQGAMVSGDKQKILAYIASNDYSMDDEDIEDLYPELMESNIEKGRSLRSVVYIEERLNPAQLKKAQAIATKNSGNMKQAIADIEKIKKGASDDKKVQDMLKVANEMKMVKAHKDKDGKKMHASYKMNAAYHKKEDKAFDKHQQNEGTESLDEKYAKSYGYTHTEEALNRLQKSLQPRSALAKSISASADNVTKEFTKMSKLMDKIMEQWEAVEMVIGMAESVNETMDHKPTDLAPVAEAAKVLSKKGDYAFSTYRNKEVDVTYKGKIIATGDFDSGADAWFLNIKGTKGQQSFNSADDVIKFFMKNKITESVSVDRRTTGFKEALKRRAEAKAKREAMKIKAAKKQAKNDMASIDANYAYDGDIEEILASANKKIMGEDAAANASSSGAVDMNPTGKNKKDKKESPMAKYGY